MLTLVEAASRLGLSPSTLRHQAQSGRLRARLIGKTYVVTEREVERYRDESRGKPGRRRRGRREVRTIPADSPPVRMVGLPLEGRSRPVGDGAPTSAWRTPTRAGSAAR